ncbi:general substrate transporter [Halenospora varia]|nr:general substrate transporter [Halenospora varia]
MGCKHYRSGEPSWDFPLGLGWASSTQSHFSETAHPSHRGTYTALANVGWWIGSFLAAWITYGTRNMASNWAWRIPSVLQFVIPAVALCGFVLAPESPRWLISKDRIEEARQFLIKYHAGGNEESPLAEFELQEICQTLRQGAEISKKTSWLDMLRTKGNRHRTYITGTFYLFSQWNGIGIVSYYLAPVLVTVGITSVTQQTMISGFLQLWNLICSIAGAVSIDRWGRRGILLFSTSGMLLSFIIISGLSGSFAMTQNAAVGVAVIPFVFVFCGFFGFGITPLLFAYICEIWPYELRARGFALGQMTASAGAFFNIFVNPIALKAIGWKYYIVYCVVIILGIINIYFTYPETGGHTLEEMSRVFDGEDAVSAKIAEVGESKERDRDGERDTKGPEDVGLQAAKI